MSSLSKEDVKREMASAMFSLLGPGYEPSYYHQMASDFVGIALGYDPNEYELVGWARPNGAGEVVFRQAAHPKNDEAINDEEPWRGMWKAVYLKKEHE